VDFDGTFAYSVTRAIQVNPLDGSTSWLVYPNPTTGYPFEIGLLDSGVYRDEPITVRIISSTGTFDVIESTAINSISRQVSDWLQSHPSGVYTLEIIWGIRREYHKVILRK